MNDVIYTFGMTAVWSDGEKLIITNPSQRKHIEDNVDRIFGLGEFKKIYAAKYSDTETKGKNNPLSRNIEIVSGYIPEKVTKDLLEKSSPGTKKSDFFDRGKLMK